MLTLCWSPKGGSGTTVVTSALALLAAQQHGTAWLLDTAGDVPAALGIGEPSGPGVHDWIASATAPVHAIDALGVAASGGLRVVARGSSTDVASAAASQRWQALAGFVADREAHCFVDGGTSPPGAMFAAAQHRLIVIRPCYLALRRAVASDLVPTGVIVVVEHGRALRSDDIAAALRAPVVAEIQIDPLVARAVDAGLLAARMPRSLANPLRAMS